MENAASLVKITEQPNFKRLSRGRNLLGTSLAATMAALYFAFIFIVAFAPSFLGTPVRSGSVMSLGVVLGVGLMVAGFLLTAIYVYVATTRLDPLVTRLKEELA